MSSPRPSFIAGLRLASSPMSSEEERAFLQQRIALFAEVQFLLSLSFLVLASAIAIALGGFGVWKVVSHPANVLHLVAALVAGGIWLFARRGQHAPTLLASLDVVASLVPMIAYGAMAYLAGTVVTDRVDLVMMLITFCVLSLRATLVPSTPRQTAIVGVLGSLPAIAVAAKLPMGFDARLSPFAAPLYVVLWAALCVVATTLSSRVIYGLRTKAAEAQRLGQYVLDEKIGEGGMGSVYRGRHALLRRPTAIKLLPPDKTGVQTITRFEREVQHTSRLTHPNTVAIYDYGRTPDGVFYYAMEYLEGTDLEQLVREHGAQAPSRVVHILTQVAGSLEEAHASGLVHRDVKPANVILCNRGGVLDTAKVVDFGLVKDVTAAADPTLSNVNAIIGTPLYMAPEAVLSPDEVDGRADLYALGCVAYYLLTGEAVFEGKTVMEICSQHLHQEPIPPSVRLGASLPRDLESLVLSCLAKRPEGRPASAGELRRALLACDVAPWTEQDARRWWAAHPQRSEKPHARHEASPAVLSVDLALRGTSFDRSESPSQ